MPTVENSAALQRLLSAGFTNHFAGARSLPRPYASQDQLFLQADGMAMAFAEPCRTSSASTSRSAPDRGSIQHDKKAQTFHYAAPTRVGGKHRYVVRIPLQQDSGRAARMYALCFLAFALGSTTSSTSTCRLHSTEVDLLVQLHVMSRRAKCAARRASFPRTISRLWHLCRVWWARASPSWGEE